VFHYARGAALCLRLSKAAAPLPANADGGRAIANSLARKPSSFSVNGIRPSHGMTTYGANVPEDSPLVELRNGLTQTTQV
jgi:hypothetical protein